MTNPSDALRDTTHPIMALQSEPQPTFDPITRDFLLQSHKDLMERVQEGDSLVRVSHFGDVPWLYWLTFQTRGLARDEENSSDVIEIDRHSIALRFLPDYLRRAQQFQMLQYVEPRRPAPFHPNICPNTGAICLEIFPAEPVLQIVETLHDLLRWRIRQLAEQDALNKAACAYGRSFVPSPIDERPLFGRQWEFQFESVEDPTS